MSLFEVNEVWIPAMAPMLDDMGFKIVLEQIRADLGIGSVVTGNVVRVLVTVNIEAESEKEAKSAAAVKIASVMVARPFIIDQTTPRAVIDLGPPVSGWLRTRPARQGTPGGGVGAARGSVPATSST